MRHGYLSPPVLIGLAIICLVTAATLFFNSYLIKNAKNDSFTDCAIGEQFAKNNVTGECKRFNNSCDIQEGWKRANATECPDLDETANWKTYTNKVLGYAIKYPEGIVIEEISERDIMLTRDGVPYGGQEGKVPAGGMVLYYRGDKGLEKGNDIAGAPTTRITINGFSAIQAKYKETSPYTNNFFISDLKNKRVVRASITTIGDDGYEESTFKIFNQILSTFQFLD